MKELERVVGHDGLTEMARSVWQDMSPNILKQARLESSSPTVKLALDQISGIEGEYCSNVSKHAQQGNRLFNI